MEKIAKADPMKKGYIVGQAIKGGLKGAGIGGGIGAGYSGIKMLKNLPDSPTKKNLVGLGVRTALGVGIGAYGGASMAKSNAINARIVDNIPKEERDRLSRLEDKADEAGEVLSNMRRAIYQNTEETEDGYQVGTVTAKQKRALRAAQKKYDALDMQYRNGWRDAEEKSKKDLIARGLLKSASEQRLGPGHTLKRTGQGAAIGAAIGGIGVGMGTASLKGLAAGTAIGAGLGGVLGRNQGRGERIESFSDPCLKRKYEKALDAYTDAHQEYEGTLFPHLDDNPDSGLVALTKKERKKLDGIRNVMNQREAELNAAHKAYKDSARQNFKNRHNKTAFETLDEMVKTAAGHEDGVKTLGKKINLEGKARVLNNLVDSSRASVSKSIALQRAARLSAKSGYSAANNLNPVEFWNNAFDLHAKTEKAKDILDRHDKRFEAMKKYIGKLKG